MKTKESIDDSRQAMDLTPTDSDAVVRASTSIPENKRRRLVRGAMAVAPLVLTLRSGALAAAASCTGVKQLPVLDSDGNFTPVNGVSTSDICVSDIQRANCPDGKISAGTNSGLVQYPPTGTDPNQLRCPRLTTNVAILSTNAMTSLRG